METVTPTAVGRWPSVDPSDAEMEDGLSFPPLQFFPCGDCCEFAWC